MNIEEYLLILLITLGFSIAVVFAKISLNRIRPERFSMIYISGATLVIFIEFVIFHLAGDAPVFLTDRITLVIIMGGIFGAFAYLFGYIGLRSVHAGISSTIFDLQGPLITFIGAIVFAIYPGNYVILGLFVAIFGLFLMGYKRNDSGKIKVTVPFIFLAFSPLLWALEWISFDSVSGPAPIFLTFLLYFSILIILVFINAVTKPPLISPVRLRVMAFIGGLFSGIANGSYGIFITIYGSTLTGIITLLSVPVGLLLIIVFLHERYTRLEIIGILAIVAGLAISTLL
jgi:drug/metabolite transporter (DMT)-like permease